MRLFLFGKTHFRLEMEHFLFEPSFSKPGKPFFQFGMEDYRFGKAHSRSGMEHFLFGKAVVRVKKIYKLSHLVTGRR